MSIATEGIVDPLAVAMAKTSGDCDFLFETFLKYGPTRAMRPVELCDQSGVYFDILISRGPNRHPRRKVADKRKMKR